MAIGRVNTGGSGTGKLFAVIAVTYPAGSVCTCTNGTKTLKAPDTGGKALFNVKAGTWTVTATDGTDTASKAVDISAEGQNEIVTLSYLVYYYNEGDQCTEVTGGWIKTGTGGTLTFNPAFMTLVANSYQNLTDASTVNTVDLTDIKTLCFSVKSATTYGTQGYPRVGIATKNNPSSSNASGWAASKTLSASSSFQIVRIDVSSLNGNYYIVFGGVNGDSGAATIEVQAVWGDDK